MNVISSLNRFLNVIREADDCRRKVHRRYAMNLGGTARTLPLVPVYVDGSFFIFDHRPWTVDRYQGIATVHRSSSTVIFLEALC